MVSTTGSELLKSFASSAESMLKKSASVKLKRKVMKTKPASKTFKSYIDLDDGGFQDEGPLRTSSPLGAKNTKDTEQTRLSWPTSTRGLPSSDEHENKTKSLSSNTSGLASPVNGNRSPVKDNSGKSVNPNNATNLCSSTGNGSGQGEDDQTSKAMSMNNVKGNMLANATDHGKSSLVKNESETAQVEGYSTPTSGSIVETQRTPGALTQTTAENGNDKNSVSNNTHDTASGLASSSRENKAVNNVQTSLPNDKDVAAKSPGEKSSLSSIESDNAKKPNNLNLIDSTSNTEKCPNVFTNKGNSNKGNLSECPKVLPKSPKVPRMSKPYSLMSGSASKDRPCSNNIASLCKIFEGESPPRSGNTDKIIEEEERDTFPIDITQDSLIKPPPEFASKPRMGSMRPMSFMCAMDAAEESPLIPDDEAENKNGQKIYNESSA